MASIDPIEINLEIHQKLVDEVNDLQYQLTKAREANKVLVEFLEKSKQIFIKIHGSEASPDIEEICGTAEGPLGILLSHISFANKGRKLSDEAFEKAKVIQEGGANAEKG